MSIYSLVTLSVRSQSITKQGEKVVIGPTLFIWGTNVEPKSFKMGLSKKPKGI